MDPAHMDWSSPVRPRFEGFSGTFSSNRFAICHVKMAQPAQPRRCYSDMEAHQNNQCQEHDPARSCFKKMFLQETTQHRVFDWAVFASRDVAELGQTERWRICSPQNFIPQLCGLYKGYDIYIYIRIYIYICIHVWVILFQLTLYPILARCACLSAHPEIGAAQSSPFRQRCDVVAYGGVWTFRVSKNMEPNAWKCFPSTDHLGCQCWGDPGAVYPCATSVWCSSCRKQVSPPARFPNKSILHIVHHRGVLTLN